MVLGIRISTELTPGDGKKTANRKKEEQIEEIV